jgi:hypothetical protein
MNSPNCGDISITADRIGMPQGFFSGLQEVFLAQAARGVQVAWKGERGEGWIKLVVVNCRNNRRIVEPGYETFIIDLLRIILRVLAELK